MSLRRKPTSDMLRRLARGELPPQEAAALRASLEDEPGAQAELALWQALPEASRSPQPGEADWERIENAVFSGVCEPVAPRRAWRLPALGFAALLLAVFSLLWFVADPASKPPLPAEAPSSRLAETKTPVVISPHLTFDTGRFESTGLSARIELGPVVGEADVRVRGLARARVQGRDTIETTADQVVSLRLHGNAHLVLGPESLLEFREFGEQVAPFLVHGSLAVAVEGPGDHPLTLLCQHARLRDIGTVFRLRSDGRGGGVLAVREGRVRLERPGHGAVEVAPDTRALWDGPTAAASLVPGLGDDDPQTLFALLKPPPAPPVVRRKPPSPPDSPAPVQPPAPPETPPSITLSDAEAELTSWQDTLDSLPLLHRQRVGRFYEEIRRQMQGGQTLRAIAGLESFIESNPGPISEKARFLLGECHYGLQDWERARSQFLDYIRRHPDGAWVEMAKFRFVELGER